MDNPFQFLLFVGGWGVGPKDIHGTGTFCCRKNREQAIHRQDFGHRQEDVLHVIVPSLNDVRRNDEVTDYGEFTVKNGCGLTLPPLPEDPSGHEKNHGGAESPEKVRSCLDNGRHLQAVPIEIFFRLSQEPKGKTNHFTGNGIGANLSGISATGG